MPELPEVETVKRGLEKYCLNKTINDVVINHNNANSGVNINGKVNGSSQVNIDNSGANGAVIKLSDDLNYRAYGELKLSNTDIYVYVE